MLRLHPNHLSHLRRLAPKGYLTDFGCYKLSWCDGRCVQGPGTYSLFCFRLNNLFSFQIQRGVLGLYYLHLLQISSFQ
ncbi:hypothetical protein CV740_00820 [Enterococcus faecium]|nr:hypothetical protein CV740_00820 [Enterococcus faecium]